VQGNVRETRFVRQMRLQRAVLRTHPNQFQFSGGLLAVSDRVGMHFLTGPSLQLFMPHC